LGVSQNAPECPGLAWLRRRDLAFVGHHEGVINVLGGTLKRGWRTGGRESLHRCKQCGPGRALWGSGLGRESCTEATSWGSAEATCGLEDEEVCTGANNADQSEHFGARGWGESPDQAPKTPSGRGGSATGLRRFGRTPSERSVGKVFHLHKNRTFQTRRSRTQACIHARPHSHPSTPSILQRPKRRSDCVGESARSASPIPPAESKRAFRADASGQAEPISGRPTGQQRISLLAVANWQLLPAELKEVSKFPLSPDSFLQRKNLLPKTISRTAQPFDSAAKGAKRPKRGKHGCEASESEWEHILPWRFQWSETGFRHSSLRHQKCAGVA